MKGESNAVYISRVYNDVNLHRSAVRVIPNIRTDSLRKAIELSTYSYDYRREDEIKNCEDVKKFALKRPDLIDLKEVRCDNDAGKGR